MPNDIYILSCPQCGFAEIRDCGNGLYQCDTCETYFDKDENIVLSEKEWLHSLNTEQLARILHKMTVACYCCGEDGRIDERPRHCVFGRCTGEKDILEWLKQPHKECE